MILSVLHYWNWKEKIPFRDELSIYFIFSNDAFRKTNLEGAGAGWEVLVNECLVTAALPRGSSSCTVSFHTGSMWIQAKHQSEVTLIRYGLLWLSGRTSLLNWAKWSRYLLSEKSLDLCVRERWVRGKSVSLVLKHYLRRNSPLEKFDHSVYIPV